MIAKTREINRQLNEEIPWFRCSDRKFEDIYLVLPEGPFLPDVWWTFFHGDGMVEFPQGAVPVP